MKPSEIGEVCDQITAPWQRDTVDRKKVEQHKGVEHLAKQINHQAPVLTCMNGVV